MDTNMGDFKSSETGVIECEVRLPCSHRVGSACITTWLRSNNTCPICRKVFFPAQQGQVLEWDVMENEDESSDSMIDGWEGESDTAYLIHQACIMFCAELGLSSNTSHVVWQIVQHLDNNRDMGSHTGSIQAIALHVATHIMNEHRSLEEISRVSGIRAETIGRDYRQIHPIREQLIGSDIIRALSGDSVQDFCELLPALNAENGFMDHGEDGNDLEYHLIPATPKPLEELCSEYGDELGQSADIRDVCSRMAGRIRAGEYLDGLSPLPVVAVGLYMASHLMGASTPIRQISDVVGISEGTIRNAYRRIYPWRSELIDLEMLEKLEDIRRHRVLQAIIWPPL